MIAAAGGDDSVARHALEILCERYWYPLYAYVRRRGHEPAESENLTQGFFVMLLERDTIQKADPDRGRFRAFMLGMLKKYMTDEWRKKHAAKRGGFASSFSLDFQSAEEQFCREPVDNETPERLFERRWALSLLDNTMARLESEYSEHGRGLLFAQLRPTLGGSKDRIPYATIADELGLTENAIKVAAHRLRKRYREILRDEVAQTVSDVSEVDDELSRLMDNLS